MDLVRFLVDARGALGFLQGARRKERGVVDELGLLPRARGRGLGRWLLRRCEALLDADGAGEVVLRVAESNSPARTLYLAEGYTPVSRSAAWERPLPGG